jgi:hypothetical protein
MGRACCWADAVNKPLPSGSGKALCLPWVAAAATRWVLQTVPSMETGKHDQAVYQSATQPRNAAAHSHVHPFQGDLPMTCKSKSASQDPTAAPAKSREGLPCGSPQKRDGKQHITAIYTANTQQCAKTTTKTAAHTCLSGLCSLVSLVAHAVAAATPPKLKNSVNRTPTPTHKSSYDQSTVQLHTESYMPAAPAAHAVQSVETWSMQW